MASDYFHCLVNQLTIDDLQVLNVLYDKHIDSLYKSIPRSRLMELTHLSAFRMNQTLTRLMATAFIVSSGTHRIKTYFITSFGKTALVDSLKGELNNGENQ